MAFGASGYLLKQTDTLVLPDATPEVQQVHDFLKPIQHTAVQTP
jgi:hypothetical protein